MKIHETMDLSALARRMGREAHMQRTETGAYAVVLGDPATEEHARALRELLVAAFDGCDTSDLAGDAWSSIVGLAIDRHAEQCGEY